MQYGNKPKGNKRTGLGPGIRRDFKNYQDYY